MGERKRGSRLVIIGASGHGRVVADIAKQCGYREIVFLDDNPGLTSCGGFPVVGGIDQTAKTAGELFVAIGNAKVREHLMTRYAERTFPVLLHPSAVIAEGVEIGRGSVVMAGSVINPGAKVGKGVIVNTCSSIDHDCDVGDYVHVAVGAHLCGTVHVGERTWIGAGATVSNNVSICEECMIGAGAVVVKAVAQSGTYVGVPAKKIK